MKIKIDSKNIDKITATLDAAQGKANARTLFAGSVSDLADRAERQLDRLDIPKKYREGARAIYFEAGLPNAYRYQAETTRIEIIRGKSAWYFVDVSRIGIYPKQKGHNHLVLAEQQLDIIMAGYREGIEL